MILVGLSTTSATSRHNSSSPASSCVAQAKNNAAVTIRGFLDNVRRRMSPPQSVAGFGTRTELRDRAFGILEIDHQLDLAIHSGTAGLSHFQRRAEHGGTAQE